MPVDHDLIVVGGGPAGRALGARGLAAGLDVLLVDPQPDRPWRATYGAWTDELPPWLDVGVVAASSPHAVVYTPRRRVVARGYTVLGTAALQASLSAGLPMLAATATSVGRRWVTLPSGETRTATTVVDARGTSPTASAPRQSAVGVRRPSPEGEMVVMDWRAVAGSARTFSYRVALGDGVELVEETCLAGVPPTSLAVLAGRAAQRDGIGPINVSGADPDVELVDFALLPPLWPPWQRDVDSPLRFGAVGGLMHPATGYSVAAALSAADVVIGAVGAGRDPHGALWPPSARAVYRLRAAGLTALLTMSDDDLAAFFDVFFGLSTPTQRAYLSSRTDLVGVMRAMWRVFDGLDRHRRRRLVRGFMTGVRR